MARDRNPEFPIITNNTAMSLIQLATELQDRHDQVLARLDTIVVEHQTALAAKDAAAAKLTADHAAILKAKDIEITRLKTQYAELDAYKTAMETKVTEVLQSGDPAQYEALAIAFLTPAQEKERQEKLARIEALKAQAAELEASLTTP